MSVVTRSQKQFVSKNVETNTKPKSKSNVKEVCLPSWFMKTISTYLKKINTSNDYQDKARLVTEMFYIINQHFDEVFKSFDDYKRQFAMIKLGETLYTKAEELSTVLALVNISKVPLKLRQLALDELKQAKQTLYPYIVNPYVVNVSRCGKSQLVLKEFGAENEVYDIYEEEQDEIVQERDEMNPNEIYETSHHNIKSQAKSMEIKIQSMKVKSHPIRQSW